MSSADHTAAASTTIPTHAIVVGLDHSPESAHALEWASAEAICRELPLHLIHATEPPLWLGPDGIEDFEEVPAGCIPEARRALAESGAGLAVTWSQPFGSALPALTGASHFATLVVVGTRARGALRRVVAGSTAVELIADAHCPVVVSRIPLHDVSSSSPVVVGVEGRPSDGDAVEAAFREAEVHQHSVVALHVTDFGYPERVRIERLIATTQRRHPTVEVAVEVPSGDPAELLVARSARASLLVLGSHGRHEAAGVVLGSVSPVVLRHADCPVLVAREGTLRRYETVPGGTDSEGGHRGK